MKDLVFPTCSLQDLPGIAHHILEEFPGMRIFAFYGELGAGKTTLIKEMCRDLGVAEDVTSPSFALINEYGTGNGELVYHFDFYRIKKLEEVLDIGYEEYLYSGFYCLLEWADKIEELLPAEYVYISVNKNDGDKDREIKASPVKR